MNKKKEEIVPVVIEDTEDLQNILIQLNLKSGSVAVISNYTAWENLALLMEALAVTAGQTIQQEGKSKKETKDAIFDYLSKVLPPFLGD